MRPDTDTNIVYHSPMLPPHELYEYERAMPGSAQRLVALVERQAKHRQQMERWLVIGGLVLSYLGLLAGLAIGVYGLYIAGKLGLQGQTVTASIIAALDITGLVGVFVYGARVQREQRSERVSRRILASDR